MTDAELLTEVKQQLGITTDDLVVNNNIKLKMLAVKSHLIKAGAKQMITDTETNENNISDIDVAVIAIGVNDLLNCKAGETRFSPVFTTLSMQICRG